MKKMLLATLVALSVACAPKIVDKPYNQGINILPVPKALTVLDDSVRFTITPNTVIVCSSPDLVQSAAFLAAKINSAAGYALKITDAPAESNFIALNLNTRVAVGNEGYTLRSDIHGVVVEARTPQGAFYGVQTLLQLLPAEIESPSKIDYVAWTIPSVEIADEPRFAYRGLMIDVCRHFVDVDFLKKQLDVLAMFKINRFHWHLTDDQAWRVEIKKYPRLTEMGSLRTEGDGSTYGPFFFTQEQIKEVVAYAAERYIDVIPEIELPGHGLAALTGYPEFSCTGGPFTPRILWGVEEDVFCVGKDATFQFLQDVVDELVPLFPSKYFHIGGDECPKVRWETCDDCQARAKALDLKVITEKVGDKEIKHSVEEQLQSYAVQRMDKYLTEKGKKMIGWDEILEGGLADGAVVMSWRGTEGGIAAATMGHEVIMTPMSGGMYIDFYQGAPEVEPITIGGNVPLSKTYSFDPIPAELDSTKHHLILGAQNNMWAEYLLTPAHYEYMIYPRVLALAEVTWSPVSKKDFTDFSRRIDNAYVRLDFHGVNYHIPMPEGTLSQNVVFTGDTVSVPFSNSRGYPMVYTTDRSRPNAASRQYSEPILLDGPTTIQIATLLPSGKTSTVRSIVVEKQEFAAAVDTSTALHTTKDAQTIRARVARGFYPKAADYAAAQFEADTLMAAFNGLKFGIKEPALVVYEGLVTLPQEAVYTFFTDMNELWIDGVQLIDNNGIASRHYHKKVQKALAAGKHNYKLVYNNMTQNGWPQSWNHIGFGYRLPGADKAEWVKAEAISN